MNTEKTVISIKSWNQNDRPREKLIAKGKNTLTDAELIAILIGSGNRNESAVALSQRLLLHVDHELNALGKLSVQQLTKFKGIGEAKAIAIIAALELGRRRRGEVSSRIEKITSSKDVYELMYPELADLMHEEFWVIYLNNSNKVLQKKQISIGGKTGTLVDARIVFGAALEFGATAVILAHNHPSGTLQPSKADKELTTKLKNGGACLDIKLLDHLIVTEKEYFSFADAAMI
ncbi:RadC family protein [Aquimarina intermedia]|uniref:DNA repair protein RadC n=1 Tax=Aquimarina intermedia TaxID=350814 RepID=A0A5S5C2T2_9FLAO|nr:DNA repair protein RadC [Aquimarina intermedia]TYP73469.1 DNA repair protein RadC [Aquimarina intermedia]